MAERWGSVRHAFLLLATASMWLLSYSLSRCGSAKAGPVHRMARFPRAHVRHLVDEPDITDAALTAAIQASFQAELDDIERCVDDGHGEVVIIDEVHHPQVREEEVIDVCKALVSTVPDAQPSIGVRLASDECIRELNQRFRGVNATTDILSFGHEDGGSAAARHHLGDLAVSIAYIERSIAHAATLSDEEKAAWRGEGGTYGMLVDVVDVQRRLSLLLVHGFCHLLGLDHETDAEHADMVAVEEDLIALLQARHRL